MFEMDSSKKTFFQRLILLLLLIVSYYACRIPLLNEPLGFEEGIFAEIVVNRPSGPHYDYYARIDGEKFYGYISHPAALYELLRLGGYLTKPLLSYQVYLDDALITPKLRSIFASYQLVFWAILLLFVFFNKSISFKWAVFIIFIAALSPLSVKTSTFLQVDNTSGVLLCGIAALLFMMAQKANLSRVHHYLLLFIGGIIAGLGKQEWSFALLAALVCMLVFIKFIKVNSPEQSVLGPLVCVTAGLLAGNAVSYLYDSVNYARGLLYIVRFSNLHETSVDRWNLTRWIKLVKFRLPYVSICLILMVPVFYTFFRKRNSFSFYLISLYGLFIFLGYMFSDHSHQQKYFSPSQAVFTVAAIFVLPGSLPGWCRKLFYPAMVMVGVSTLIFLIGFSPNPNPHLDMIHSGRLQPSPETVFFISSGAAWNKPEINYVNNNLDYEKLKPRISEKYNKQLVKPEDIE